MLWWQGAGGIKAEEFFIIINYKYSIKSLTSSERSHTVRRASLGSSKASSLCCDSNTY